jgi:5'(3')-deoxyribonucleotidase
MSNPVKQPSIAIDMDHVMADTGAYLCQWLNERFGLDLSDESFKTLRDTLEGEPRQAMMDHVADGELMRHLPLMEGCQDVIGRLSKRHGVVICTAAMEYPKTIAPKIDWLNEHFPDLDPKCFVFCGYKQVMGTDYLIDDSPKHFPGFSGTPVLYDAPHNRDVTEYDRVASWSEIAEYFSV